MHKKRVHENVYPFHSRKAGVSMRLGTYSTFDAPTKDEDKALEWLREEFDKIGGRVRKIYNNHDFGMYPSFEIDYPHEIGYIVDMDDDKKTCEDDDKVDAWHDKANEIEDRYSEKFMQD